MCVNSVRIICQVHVGIKLRQNFARDNSHKYVLNFISVFGKCKLRCSRPALPAVPASGAGGGVGGPLALAPLEGRRAPVPRRRGTALPRGQAPARHRGEGGGSKEQPLLRPQHKGLESRINALGPGQETGGDIWHGREASRSINSQSHRNVWPTVRGSGAAAWVPSPPGGTLLRGERAPTCGSPPPRTPCTR